MDAKFTIPPIFNEAIEHYINEKIIFDQDMLSVSTIPMKTDSADAYREHFLFP
jgi:hypothetical protein